MTALYGTMRRSWPLRPCIVALSGSVAASEGGAGSSGPKGVRVANEAEHGPTPDTGEPRRRATRRAETSRAETTRWWHHLATVVGSGCVIWFFSEMFFLNEGQHLYFWSTSPDVAALFSSVAEWLFVFLLFYAFFALWLLVPISVFRVRSMPALVLAGAICGWAIEGSAIPIMYEELWGSLLWPAASWHVLVNVLLGWWWLRRVLEERSARFTAVVFVGMGVVWSVWATWFWPLDGTGTIAEATAPMAPTDFAFLAFLSSTVLAFGYWILDRFGSRRFVTGKAPLAILIAAGFVLSILGSTVFVPILAVLVGLASFVLDRNRRTERDGDILARFAHSIRPSRYPLLFLMPAAAVVLYPILHANDVSIAPWIGYVLYPLVVTSAAIIALSTLDILRRARQRTG